MIDRVFVDTNILVYAIEANGPDRDKTRVAREVLRDPGVCLSTQVLGEFYRAVTSARRASPLGHDEAVAWVQLWKRHEIRPVTVATVDLALAIAQRFRVGYYDALILAAARLAGCGTVYSEDLASGQDYGGTRVLNPFAAR